MFWQIWPLIAFMIALWLGSLTGRLIARRSSWFYGAPAGIVTGLVAAVLLISLGHILPRF